MTQDYKDELLKYLTGNITPETGEDKPGFLLLESTGINISTEIEEKLNEIDTISNYYILGKIYDESYEAYLVYGVYVNSSSEYYGYIYLVDKDFYEIQMITEFDSGTRLFPIVALNQDENKNLYGISYTSENGTGTTRVLLLNNILASGLLDGTYKAILRNSYISPYTSTIQYPAYKPLPYRQNRIVKSPESATYYIIYPEEIVKFVINVGSTNEWTSTALPHEFSSRFETSFDKSSGEEVLLFYGVSSNVTPAVYYELEINDTTVTQKKAIELDSLAGYYATQVYFKDTDDIYIYADYNSLGKGVIYKVNGNALDTIYTCNYAEYDDDEYYTTVITIFGMNGGVFFFENYKDRVSRTVRTTKKIGYIRSDNTYNINTIFVSRPDNSPTPAIYEYVDFYYRNVYNLIYFYMPSYSGTPTSTFKVVFDYNSINYNGTSYSNINSLLPNKARLYDSNGKIIFARNLYNKLINSNTTISTVNVPNTNLNNTTISVEGLISETNIDLIDQSEEITKNIYENLNINFSNTLKMVNENDPNNIIFTQEGSNRINKSVNSTLDYDNTKVTKARINYSDGTTKIIDISFVPLRNYFYTKFWIYVGKEIKNIEFISNDEATVYNTISPEFELNKFYTIKQKVTIDDPEEGEELLYDSEQVYYNDEEVYY